MWFFCCFFCAGIWMSFPHNVHLTENATLMLRFNLKNDFPTENNVYGSNLMHAFIHSYVKFIIHVAFLFSTMCKKKKKMFTLFAFQIKWRFINSSEHFSVIMCINTFPLNFLLDNWSCKYLFFFLHFAQCWEPVCTVFGIFLY